MYGTFSEVETLRNGHRISRIADKAFFRMSVAEHHGGRMHFTFPPENVSVVMKVPNARLENIQPHFVRSRVRRGHTSQGYTGGSSRVFSILHLVATVLAIFSPRQRVRQSRSLFDVEVTFMCPRHRRSPLLGMTCEKKYQNRVTTPKFESTTRPPENFEATNCVTGVTGTSECSK